MHGNVSLVKSLIGEKVSAGTPRELLRFGPMVTERLHGVTFATPLSGVGLAVGESDSSSEFALDVLPAAELPWTADSPLTARWLESGEACELAVRGVGKFVVTSAIIAATPVPGVREDLLRLFLRYHAVGLRMRIAGFAVLHGAAVSLDGRAHVWVGASGAGKTSSAVEACARGARFLADEVVVLRPSPDGFFVRRGVPWPRVEAGAPMGMHELARRAVSEAAEEVPLADVRLARAVGGPGEAAQLAAQILGGYRPELGCTPVELQTRGLLLDALLSLRG